MTDREDQIAEILADWRQAKNQGEPVDPELVIASHPALADELRARFAALHVLEATFGDTDDAGVPRTLGEYRIIRELGRGGMGVVYEAEQSSMQRRVALKVLYPAITNTTEAVKRFEQEARSAGRLHHTNIVPVHVMGRDAGVTYYAMELVHGVPLDGVIKKLRALGSRPREEQLAAIAGMSDAAHASSSGPASTGDRAYFVRIATMFAGVAEALELAHGQGVIHRDIKPANLILDDDGTVKILDFGLARVAADGPSMTVTGRLLGTPLYMSPEQAMAKRVRIDHRTDIYSLGATMYEVLTLRTPFEGRDLQDICSQILSKDPALPRRTNPRIPKDLETIVMKAIERDRDKRYGTAESLAIDLRLFAAGAAIHARPVGVVERTWRKVRRRKVRASLAAAVVLLAVTLAIIATRHGREKEQRRELEYTALCARGHSELIRLGAAPQMSQHHEFSVADSSAADSFAKAIALLPDRPDAYFGRALATGRTTEERLDDLAAAKARGLPVRTVHMARAEFLRRAKRIDEAKREDEIAASLPHGEAAIDAYLDGRIQLLRGDYEPAHENLSRAIASAERGEFTRQLALRARAQLHERAMAHGDALEDYLEAKGAGDESIDVQVAIASLWRRLGQTDRAAQAFDTILAEQAENSDEDRALLCRACFAHQEREWATRAADEALRITPDSVSVHREMGMALELSGYFDQAAPYLKRWVELDPTNANAHRALGGSLAQRGDTDASERAIKEAIRLDPTNWRSYNTLGGVLLVQGKRDAAIGAWREAARMSPAAFAPHANIGIRLWESDDFSGAAAAFREALRLDPSRALLRTHLGDVLYRMGDLDGAIDAYRESIRLDPALPDSNVNLVLTLLLKGNVESAVKWSREMARRHPNAPMAFATLSEALRVVGDAAGAAAAARRTKQLTQELAVPDVENAQAFGVLGGKLIELGDAKRAVIAFREAIRLNPAARYHQGLAIALLAAGDAKGAVSAAREVTRLAPHEAKGHSILGTALERTGDLKGAIAAGREAVRLDPTNSDAQNNLGNSLMLKGDLGHAEARIREAIRLNPRNKMAHVNLMHVHYRKGDMAGALTEAQELVRLYPKEAGLYGNLSEALKRAGKLDDALKAANHMIALAPGDARGYKSRAAVLSDMRKYPESLESTAKAIELDPNDADSWGNRGVALWSMGKTDAALEAVDTAVRLAPKNVSLLANRGAMLQALKRYDDALKDLLAAERLAPNNPHVLKNLAVVFKSLGRFSDSLKSVNRAIRLNPRKADLHRVRGEALIGLKQYDEALKALDDAIRIQSRSPIGHYQRGRVLRLMGKPIESLMAYERSLLLGAEDAGMANQCAWFRATSADPKHRNAERAVALARHAVKLAPLGAHWNTLGVALCRAGKWEDALHALGKSQELTNGGTAFDWFFVAIAKHKLGKADAKEWYDKAVVWMDKNQLAGEALNELKRFRAEAEEVLGIENE